MNTGKFHLHKQYTNSLITIVIFTYVNAFEYLPSDINFEKLIIVISWVMVAYWLAWLEFDSCS